MVKDHKNANIPIDDMYNVWIDNFSDNKEKQQLREETQAWAENLRQATIDSSLSTANTKLDLTIEQTWLKYEKDIRSWFLSAIDNLIEEIKDTRKWISKKWLSKGWRRWIKEDKDNIKQHEKQLIGKKNSLLKEAWREISDDEIFELKKIRNNLNKIRKDIGMSQRWYHENTASYLYNSPEIAKKSNKHQADNLEFEQKLQTELRDWAIKHIFNRTTRNANEFYRKIAEWRYVRADYEFFMRNRSVLAPSFQRCGIAIPTRPIQHIWNWWKIEKNQRTTRKSVDYSNMDWWETLEKWWVAGVLDKLLSDCGNMTPWQKNTWKSLWVLACFAGWIYWLYKFYTNKNTSLRYKAWITAWTIFWSQALTGEWPLSLFNKLMTGGLSMDELKNKFGNVVWWLGSSEAIQLSETTENALWIEWSNWEIVSENVAPAMYSMMIFNSSTKVSDIKTMTQSFGDNNIRKAFYKQSCNKLEKNYWTEAAECFRVTFSDQFDENKWTNRLASIWIVLGTTNNNESVYWLSNNATMNAIILEKYQTENWLKVKDKAMLQAYIKDKKTNNQAIDIDDLDKHKNTWFIVNEKATFTERPGDIQNKKDLISKVEWLSMDTTKKEELKQAIQDFYDERQIKNKPDLNDFSLRIENWLLIVKSHDWNETKIDLNNYSIKCNNSKFQVNNLSEALNIADITNYILWLTNKKKPANANIFSYNRVPQKAICFNDNSGKLNFFDTSILGVNRIRNRETIDKNASAYVEFLSEQRKEVNKLNLTDYPLVKQLWIDFFSNENEVKKLENRLKWVKQKLSVYTPASINPFSIWKRSKKLIFKREWNGWKWIDESFFPENIHDEFPTLNRTWNEEIFLQYMNNPNNKMRWSAISS